MQSLTNGHQTNIVLTKDGSLIYNNRCQGKRKKALTGALPNSQGKRKKALAGALPNSQAKLQNNIHFRM